MGIGHVVLLDDVPEVSKRGDPDVERAIQGGLLIFGAYRARSSTLSAHIILIVRSLYRPMLRVFVHTSAMTLSIANIISP